MKKIKFTKAMQKDVYGVCGGFCSMNAPHAIGYLFLWDPIKQQIECGMFCDWESEIDKNEWTYYFEFKTQFLYKL